MTAFSDQMKFLPPEQENMDELLNLAVIALRGLFGLLEVLVNLLDIFSTNLKPAGRMMIRLFWPPHWKNPVQYPAALEWAAGMVAVAILIVILLKALNLTD
jgi:hypothetical protein